MKKVKYVGILSLILVITLTITGCFGKKTSKNDEFVETKYHLVFDEAEDAAETTTIYDIVVKEKTIEVSYTNTFAHPERADGPLPKESGSFTITDSFFYEPLVKVLKIWNDEHGQDIMIDDAGFLLMSSLEDSQNRNDDLCEIYGQWYCDIYGNMVDYNSDGKITVEENFSYYVHEIDPTITLVEDTRKETDDDELKAWKQKGLIPELVPSSSTQKFKTTEKVNQIVLNGVTFELEVDKLQKMLDAGFVITGSYETEIYNSHKVLGYFENYPDVEIYVSYHTIDHRTLTPYEDCIINRIEVKLKPNTSSTFYWKIKDFKVDENTTKTEINEYFGLKTNGGKTVNLYTDELLTTLSCGSIYDSHDKYSNIFVIETSKITSSYKIPTWAE